MIKLLQKINEYASNLALVFIAFVLVSSIGLVTYLFVFGRFDNEANKQFAIKAKQLEIQGKTREYVISNFGKPDFSFLSDGNEILVYTPGPKFALLNSECKVRLNSKTDLVDGWITNSD
jgi:hypothetical protein